MAGLKREKVGIKNIATINGATWLLGIGSDAHRRYAEGNFDEEICFPIIVHRCRADAIFSTSDFDLRDAGIFEELQLTQMAIFFCNAVCLPLLQKKRAVRRCKF